MGYYHCVHHKLAGDLSHTPQWHLVNLTTHTQTNMQFRLMTLHIVTHMLLVMQVEVEVEHGLLMENLLDLAHAPFTHTTTFAKGWPIPDSVKFKAAEYLGGNWEPYPIDMTFQPPCCVQSTIGLAQPGKILRGQSADSCKNHLHQLHVCLPSRPGHTRLLYRMSMDFMQWVRWVPGIQKFWQNIAGQVTLASIVYHILRSW